MDPLLRNIEHNPEISAINSNLLAKDLPKVYAYADDVNGVIKNKAESLKAVFKEYARLTKVSGLELNAEKTELNEDFYSDTNVRPFDPSIAKKPSMLDTVNEKAL